MDHPNEPTDAEVDAIIAEFGGDVRAAIRALLHDIAVLAEDFTASVSRGYIRRGFLASAQNVQRRRTGAD